MNVVKKPLNKTDMQPDKSVDFGSISDVKKQTYKVLHFIEEITWKEVLKYQDTIWKILEQIANDKVLEQQDYFRFTVGYLLREKIQTGLKYNEYETYVFERNKEIIRKEEQENKLALSKSVSKAQVLYEALAPIHNRLMRIKLFFDNLDRHDKLSKQTKFNTIYNQKIEIVDKLSKRLISDKWDLSKLEEDAKYMRDEEKLIMDVAKESYKLYMLQIYKTPAIVKRKQLSANEVKQLFNQWSKQTLNYNDYKGLQVLFEETVKNSEDFWVFHEKFFSVLIRLWLREDRRKKKR